MGLIHADVDLSHPRRRELASLKVTALVDTGAIICRSSRDLRRPGE